jgi:ATP-dependent helicase/nuclease subunit A
MAMDEATRAQVEAAAPDRSTWLSANAGSGKTRVLTDRVARLLLEGTAPERILCLTYTKAAAMEMQNRLFRRLGAWAMLDDGALSETLAQVGVTGVSAPVLSHARTLFARAIEAPGGLKIQTIHSFCSSVLRRFPLEAGVTPGFEEIDERVQNRLLAEVLQTLAERGDGQAALDGLAPHLSGDDALMAIGRAILDRAEAFAQPWERDAILTWAGVEPGLDEAALLAEVFLGGEAELAARVRPHLDPSSPRSSSARLHAVLGRIDWARPDLVALAELEGALLSGASAQSPFTAKIDGIGNKAVRAAIGADMAPLNDLMRRVEAARPRRLALQTALRTEALHRFAAVLLPAYQAAKVTRGWLDFDDLIARTRRLLDSPAVAQWVLYRLDGGIDHILVDEAQDTSPSQWEIVERLAEDFAAGAGSRPEVARTIFVVGDKKQSIFSFQGADPAEFDRMRAVFAERCAAAGAPFAPKMLEFSFRSAPAILDLVDAVAAGAGAAGVGPDVRHRPFSAEKPGRVDLWPVVEPATAESDPPWHDPVDQVSQDHHSNRLARAVAERIEAMIAAREPVTVGGLRRPVEAGDFLILLRGRHKVAGLFGKIIDEIKSRGLPIAGIDRSEMGDPLAVRDLMSMLRFLATPEDDLSLAEVLRSPLGGWTEAALFDVAQSRGEGVPLWRALQSRGGEWPETIEMLTDLRDSTDFLRPYDLLERILIRWNGRQRLLTRLGAEVEDAIDALLSQALAYERLEVPSLTGFIGWIESGDVIVKRDLAKPNGQIRVMTVHGAKGLEAPVVILPDCGASSASGGGARITLLQPDGGPVTWPKGGVAEMPPPVAAADAARAAAAAEEANRLLYVALTRAETWLIVAAAGSVGKSPEASWYQAVRAGLESLGAVSYCPPELEGGGGLRLERGDWTAAAPGTEATVMGGHGAPDPGLPAWASAPAAPSRRAERVLSPSDLGGAKVVEEPRAATGAGETAQALRRGRLVHLLLEHLPRLPQPAWAAAAPGICALEPGGIDSAELPDLLAEAIAVLTAPALGSLFSEHALAEVPITGHSPTLRRDLYGVIDRLIVAEGKVLAVDFKTNAVVPDRPEAVPEGLLRQMGAYAALLEPLYPAHRIDTAILWTRDATLMHLPHRLLAAALDRAAGEVGVAGTEA